MEQELKMLIKEIDKCYQLAGLELLESSRLEDTETKILTTLRSVTDNIGDEILSLTYKKMSSGWRNKLSSGFVGISTADRKLEIWRIFINEVLRHLKASSHTFKSRLEAEGLYIESRSKNGGDLHLLIGRRDGKSDKAHAIVDERTGDIRVEDNQTEPLELVRKIESIITLGTGKKIKVTRESIEEINEG